MQAIKEGIPKVHYLQLTTNDYDNYHDWCGGHPSAVADRVIAQQLVSFVGLVHQNWTTATTINATVDQVNHANLIWECLPRRGGWKMKACSACSLFNNIKKSFFPYKDIKIVCSGYAWFI